MNLYNKDDIVILGDSFCQHRNIETDWPYYLNTLLTGSKTAARGKGFGGGSWWSVRKQLYKELETAPFKVLIVCHTDYSRLWRDDDRGFNPISIRHENLHWLGQPEREMDYLKQLSQAGDLYYKHLYSNDFHKWAQLQWFEELDKFTKEQNIEKVIHLHCFDGTTSFVFKNGINITNTLLSYCNMDELHNIEYRNHYPSDFNVKFAAALYNALNTNENSSITSLSL